MKLDESLLRFATEREAEYIKAINRTGSQSKAAKDQGVNDRTLTRALAKVRERAAKQGYSPRPRPDARST